MLRVITLLNAKNNCDFSEWSLMIAKTIINAQNMDINEC